MGTHTLRTRVESAAYRKKHLYISFNLVSRLNKDEAPTCTHNSSKFGDVQSAGAKMGSMRKAMWPIRERHLQRSNNRLHVRFWGQKVGADSGIVSSRLSMLSGRQD